MQNNRTFDQVIAEYEKAHEELSKAVDKVNEIVRAELNQRTFLQGKSQPPNVFEMEKAYKRLQERENWEVRKQELKERISALEQEILKTMKAIGISSFTYGVWDGLKLLTYENETFKRENL